MGGVDISSGKISIHALREEGDLVPVEQFAETRRFLSTPSARRATRPALRSLHPPRISIHALREEGDQGRRILHGRPCDFYPRPPRGGRPFTAPTTTTTARFLSTPSARRATSFVSYTLFSRSISIHALREEGDGHRLSVGMSPTYFYPRPPRGGRPGSQRQRSWRLPISIHALREEGDKYRRSISTLYRNFYPRPPRGGRPGIVPVIFGNARFLSTPSARRATSDTP